MFMWSLSLGTKFLLVPETFKFKNFESCIQLPTITGVSSNTSLSSCLYWYAILNSCKYLKTHLWNVQVNNVSLVNKEIFKICLVLDMVNKNCLWIAVGSIKRSFLWKLLPLIGKRFYNLSYKPICGLLCLLNYWESINSYS